MKVQEYEDARYQEAAARHPVGIDHVMARVNSLKKHYDYTTDAAWDIVNRNEGTNGPPNPIPQSQSLYLSQENYIVTDVEGKFMLFDDEARNFVESAVLLRIPRHTYRVFKEVSDQ
jgi:hypothetical protein